MSKRHKLNRGPVPLCAHWQVWVGPECEGTTDQGVLTLFIRSLDGVKDPKENIFKKYLKDFPRVWFCHEFRNWRMIEWVVENFPKHPVCLDILAEDYETVSRRLSPHVWGKVFRYVALPFPLRAGDTICAGVGFSKATFTLPTPVTTNPESYGRDTRII